MREGRRDRAHPPGLHAGGAAAGAGGEARHVHGGQRRAGRHAAGRRGADPVVVLARPCQRDRPRPASGSTSSTSRWCSSPRRCSSSNIRAAGWKRSRPRDRRRCGSRRARRSGRRRDAKVVEIAGGIMPTIALHLIRQPAGGHLDCAKTTTNNIYAVISGKARFTAEGGLAETLGPGDVIALPCWHQQPHRGRRRIRRSCACRTSHCWRSSGFGKSAN